MLTAEMAIQPARDKHGSGMVAESRSYTGFLLCYNQACSSHTYSINRHTKHTMRNDHALITGGGSGIGLATARRFREDNFKVTILDVVDPSSVAQKIGAQSVTLDVQDESLIEELAIHLAADSNPVSVLVTCAGPLQRPLPPGELSWKEWDLIQRIHLRGSYACCRSFGERMARSKTGGAIVLVSSISGLRSSPLHSYGPAKAAIIHLAKTLAAEWGPSGVRVNCVCPGFTATPALARGVDNGALHEHTLKTQSALGRLVEPGEVADAIAFLASPAASGITGAILPVDAGHQVASDWDAYGGLPEDQTSPHSDPTSLQSA